MPDGPIEMNKTDSIVTFYANGIFTIQSNDFEMVGNHELRIKASLVEYPSIETIIEIILPL